MNKSSSPFQIILIGVFIFAAVVGVIVFASYNSSSKNVASKALIWGIMPEDDMKNLLAAIDPQKKSLDITYVQKNADTFESEFVNALAEGAGPDLVIIDDSKLFSWRTKLQPLSFKNIPQRVFNDTFIDSANIFVMQDGIYALPFYVDPLVTYWNKTMFSDAGIVLPPKTWNDLSTQASKLTSRTDKSEIIKSGVALGESVNIDHSKEIFVNLMLQGENPLIKYNADTKRYDSVADVTSTIDGINTLGQTVDFYTSFSNPNNERYSWNRSLAKSRDVFVANKLAIYFGYASEYPVLQRKNPNLNFDVAGIPKVESRPSVGYAKINAIALVKQSKNQGAAFNVMTKLVSNESQSALVKIINLPSARRDMLVTSSGGDTYTDVFIKAAIQSKTWLDPNPVATDYIFREMIDTITTGKVTSSEARNILNQKLLRLISGGSASDVVNSL